MSSRRPDLSPEAERDFDCILVYTGRTWGSKQLEAYFEKIDKALLNVDRNPHVGGSCPGLPEEYRRFLVGSHMIVYRIREGKVQILRILHQRMSLDAMQGDLSD